MANNRDPQASQSQDPNAQAAAAQVEAPPEGLDVRGTQWETHGCTEISGANGEMFVELPDGTHHSLGAGVSQISAEDLQRQLQSKGKAALSDEKIAQLREDGFVE